MQFFTLQYIYIVTHVFIGHYNGLSYTDCHAVCVVAADTLGGKDIRRRKEAEKDDRVCGIQTCCLMESAHINIVCISKQELLSVSKQHSRLLPLTIWDR